MWRKADSFRSVQPEFSVFLLVKVTGKFLFSGSNIPKKLTSGPYFLLYNNQNHTPCLSDPLNRPVWVKIAPNSPLPTPGWPLSHLFTARKLIWGWFSLPDDFSKVSPIAYLLCKKCSSPLCKTYFLFPTKVCPESPLGFFFTGVIMLTNRNLSEKCKVDE